MAKDSRLLDWYSFLEDKGFTDQLHQAVSTVLLLYSILQNYINSQMMQVIYFKQKYLLQGFSDLSLMPGEVVAILHKVKHYLG